MKQSSLSSTFVKPTISVSRVLAIASNVCIGAVFAIFAFSAWQNWKQSGDIRMLVLAFQELLIVGLVITRQPSTYETRSPWDWTVAIVGTVAILFLRPGGVHLPMLLSIGMAIQFVGMFLSTIAVFNLWRSFGIVAALRTVRTTGFYSIVRHPLYATYLISYIGFIFANPSLLNISLVVLATYCQYARAIAEERVLRQDPSYDRYMRQVRYRFIPFVF